ncbi:MAG: hypothetical protein D6814_03070 [Calditrichaeota bacterium]|nr:MAG: hypothetical protein D6814_03070 [Calditrichota bacterium]
MIEEKIFLFLRKILIPGKISEKGKITRSNVRVKGDHRMQRRYRLDVNRQWTGASASPCRKRANSSRSSIIAQQVMGAAKFRARRAALQGYFSGRGKFYFRFAAMTSDRRSG